MDVERRQRVAADDHLVDAGGGGQQRGQGLEGFDHHPRAALGDEAGVADELDGVAHALLAVQEDGLAGDVLAFPARHGQRAARAQRAGDAPARLVVAPAVLEAAKLQMAIAAVDL
ncbi:MAG: hypothetical protein WDN45_03210 [Caulobacteraceae bacterium]